MKPVFELSNQTAQLTNFNPRAEKHGDEPKPAADLHFAVALANRDLAMLDPSLRSLLYSKEGAADVDLADQSNETPYLRFPKLSGPLKWKHDIVGATLTVDYGLGGSSDLVITGCDVNNFTLDCQQGGTVMVGFRVQCHPSQEQNGKLSYMIGQEVEITLEPPEEKAPDLAEQGDKPKRGRKARETAGAAA